MRNSHIDRALRMELVDISQIIVVEQSLSVSFSLALVFRSTSLSLSVPSLSLSLSSSFLCSFVGGGGKSYDSDRVNNASPKCSPLPPSRYCKTFPADLLLQLQPFFSDEMMANRVISCDTDFSFLSRREWIQKL